MCVKLLATFSDFNMVATRHIDVEPRCEHRGEYVDEGHKHTYFATCINRVASDVSLSSEPYFV